MTSYSEAATELFEQAEEYRKRGADHQAISLYSLSLQTEVRPRTYLERAKLYQKSGNLESAMNDVHRGISICQPFFQDFALLRQLNNLRKEIEPALNRKRIRQSKLLNLSNNRDLDGLLDALKLSNFRDAIMRHSEMSARIRLTRISADISKSKFGGRPDLPEEASWPSSSSGAPLSFLAQISMSDLSKTCASELCGGEGLLSFFYDADEQPWGYDPQHREGWKVLHFSKDRTLIRAEYPSTLPDHCKFSECSISFENELTFPTYDCEPDLSFSRIDFAKYIEFCQSWYGDSPHHHLYGHPQLIQGAMWKLKCQLASNGVFVGDPNSYESEKALELASGAEQWKLLLQVDIDEMTGMEWGDGGNLYFCVNQSELEKNDFSKVWTILQCL